MTQAIRDSFADNSLKDGVDPTIGGAEVDANPLIIADILDGTTSTALGQNGTIAFSGATTFGGILSVDDTTDSTSGTTGSIHTDGGLGVAKDLYVGDDILLASGAVINFDGGDVTLTHSANTLTLAGGSAVGFDSVTDSKFHVYHSAGDTNVTGDGTVYTVTYGTESFDTGGDFASNTFTAPETGKYLLVATISATGVLSAHTFGQVNITTSNQDYQPVTIDPWNISESPGVFRISASVVADMDAADTAIVKFTVSGSTKVVDMQNTRLSNNFSGALLA